MEKVSMDDENSEMVRASLIERVLAKQDSTFRWGYDEKVARQRPQYVDYSPNYRSTLWTLILLADIQAPADLPQVQPALSLIVEEFFDPEQGVFRLPGMMRFPIPCLNGNMIYLLQYFKADLPELLEKTSAFFASYQRFDDGDFKTPSAYPYKGNHYCYGKHTCFWGVTKLFKGLSFIPKDQRTQDIQRLIENCVEFVLQHEVCFGSQHAERFLHKDINVLTFPNFYKSDYLELLWLLAREEVRDRRTARALDLLRSRMKPGGVWELERPLNTIVPVGQKGVPNPFVTERAKAVLAFNLNIV